MLTKTLLIALLIAGIPTAVAAQESEAEKSAARLATLFAAISTEGGTTAKDGAGSIEASMLAASAVGMAAAAITVPKDGKILVLADDQTLGLSIYFGAVRSTTNLETRMRELRQLKGVPKMQCKPILAAAGGGDAVALAALTGFLGAIRQKTEIGSVSVTATSSMLARAVAGKIASQAIVPDNLPQPDPKNSPFGQRLDALESENGCWRAYLQTLKEDPKKPHVALAIANIKTVTDDVSAFAANLTKLDDKGQSAFAQTISVESIAKTNKLSVLRLKVDAAGGTTILRNNFLTLFGADAMRVTGGIVVSYSLLDNSTVIPSFMSGLLVCPTGLARVASVHSDTVSPPACKKI